MAGKLISDLNSGTLSLADAMEIDKDVSGTRTSFKTTVKDIVNLANHNVADEYDSTSTYAVDDYVIYESVLYKCISATTGTFDSTKWTAVVVTDEMGSGGGGGTGGHTIIDENGNSMTARSGLQFFGAVEVRDDNANNRTLVEVLGGDFYNPVIYSTEEREIGVWTDGKPLYEKSIEGTTSTSSPNNNIQHNITNIDKVVDIRGIVFRGDGTSYPVEFPRNGVNVWCQANTTTISLNSDKSPVPSDFSGKDYLITLQYTKTTDTAGSGTWTPQGVPAVHYSTDEQVIGTWIDGSTLYEKTIDFGALPNNNSKSVNHNISNLDKIISINGIAIRTTDGNTIPIPHAHYNTLANQLQLSAGSTTVDVRTGSDASNRNGYITIQYTKSS